MKSHLTAGSAHLIREMDSFLKKAGIPRQNQDLDGATMGTITSIVAFTQNTGLTPKNKAKYMAMVGAVWDGIAEQMREDPTEAN